MNDFVFQHKMDEVKAEPDSDSYTPPMFLSSEHQLLEMNDEGPVTFDILRNGAKVSFYFCCSVNSVSELFEKELCVGSHGAQHVSAWLPLLPHLIFYLYLLLWGIVDKLENFCILAVNLRSTHHMTKPCE